MNDHLIGNEAKPGAVEQHSDTPAAGDERAKPTRREFLSTTLAVSSLPLSGLLPAAAAAPATATTTAAALAQPEPQSTLITMGEIVSSKGRLRGLLTLTATERRLPKDSSTGTPDETQLLRYLEGTDAAGHVWPPKPQKGVVPPALPGPTLRARVGDRVELTFLNHVRGFGTSFDRVEAPLDRVERGESVAGCDVVKLAPTTSSPTPVELYPTPAGDRAPNCFHGSSTVNVHFHGTHVTPDGLGDNVLLQLRPAPDVDAQSVKEDFARIFEAGPPSRWNDLPRSWRERQLRLLKRHDDTAIWKGVRGVPGKPALPEDKRLVPPTLARIKNGLWPQYQVGAYPYCFDLTEFKPASAGSAPRYEMGQCPGTHWYHAHKHGSTALNVLHGLAGVFIIEGGYDDDWQRIYPNLKATEKVLLVHNLATAPNLMRITPDGNAFRPNSLLVNGGANPTLIMQPCETQLWRFVNASIRAVATMGGFDPVDGVKPDIRQTAQDGVQFTFENFKEQPYLSETAAGQARAYKFAPGNRVDLLVRAPLRPGPYEFKILDTTTGIPATLLTLVVAGAPVKPIEFPSTPEDYPKFPTFLGDIPEEQISIRRQLDFGWEPGRPGPGGGQLTPAPRFSIDGLQFRGDRYDQTMILGDCEEWTLFNSTTTIAHPFHIHVNPFQVVEIFDPLVNEDPEKAYKTTTNHVWHDVIAIPPAITTADGKLIRGSVKIRHRFADFAGSYVLHCHMLAHEDRGMMQLLRVIPGDSVIPHH